MTFLFMNLLGLLSFALVFYLAMRGGWGAEMVHGAHLVRHSEAGGRPDPAWARDDSLDPVCGMKVAADEGWAHVLDGRTYRFCSKSCRTRFEADPRAFVPEPKENTQGERP